MAIAFIGGDGAPSTTSAIDTTGATLLVAMTGSTDLTSTPPDVTDSEGNTWVRLVSNFDQVTGSCIAWFVLNPTTSATHTVTVTNEFPSISFGAFSGVHGLILGEEQTANSGGTNSFQPGSITPPNDNSLLIAGMSYRDTSSISVDSSYSIAGQEPFLTSVSVGSCLAYQIQTTATARNPTFSWTSASLCCGIHILFEEDNAGAGGSGESSHVF